MRRLHAPRRRTSIRRAVLLPLCTLALAAGAGFAQSPPAKGDAARGAARAAACESCHGTPERAPLAGAPTLAGQQADFLVLQMILLREGLRDVPQMAGLLKGYSDPDLQDVAAHYARQNPPRNEAARDPALHARGGALAQSMGCGSCHYQGYRGQQHLPRLANQREDYLAATLKAYRENQRSGIDTSMNAVMYKVSDGDIQALAHFLAHQ